MDIGVEGTGEERRSFAELWRVYTRPRMLIMLLFGAAAGLPILLVFSTLSGWLNDAGVSKSQIGLFAWVGFAYTIKFAWSPFLDRTPIPVLDSLLGRRRAWMIVAQIGVICSLLAMSAADPTESLAYVAIVAILIAFFSATQDIAIDAWRIEAAPDEEQGAMAAAYQLGYRLGMILAGAGALILSDIVGWPGAYQAMAAIMAIGVLTALFAPKVESTVYEAPPRQSLMETVSTSVIGPFGDFLRRYRGEAIFILALIAAYRVPDFVMGFMALPFYQDIGFTNTEIGIVSKTFGPWMTILGAFLGGALMARFGLMWTLLVGAVSQATTNLLYALLFYLPTETAYLAITITSENIALGLAGSALIAYMSSLTNRAFTATQYALFSSFYALPGKFLGGFSGFAVDAFGFPAFFVGTALMGIPSVMLVLFLMRKEGGKGFSWGTEEPAAQFADAPVGSPEENPDHEAPTAKPS